MNFKLSLILVLFHSVFLFGQNERFSKELLLKDVDFLFSNIEATHPDMYANITKDDFNKELFDIKSKINKDLELLEFYEIVAPLVAKIRDGHTSIGYSRSFFKNKNIELFPFAVKINSKDSTVTIKRNYSEIENEKIIGATIISINDIPIKTIVERMLLYPSGEKLFYRLSRLESKFDELLYIFYRQTKFKINCRINGNKESYQVKGITDEDVLKRKSGIKKSTNRKNFSFKTIPDQSIGIIDFRSFSDHKKFSVFLDSIFTIIKEEKIENLIIDIRDNGGGNSVLGDKLFQYISPVPFRQFGKSTVRYSYQQKAYYKKSYKKVLPWYLYFYYTHHKNGYRTNGKHIKLHKLKKNKLRYTGNVFLLTNNNTFSSASSFSWAFKYFNMGTVVGEETGGLAITFGDIVVQNLPTTKLYFVSSHKKFYMYGAKEGDCHGTIPDYEVDSDDAMDFTLDLIKKETK